MRMCELRSVWAVHVNWGYSVLESFKEHTTIKYREGKRCSSLVLHKLVCTIMQPCFMAELKDTLWHAGKLHPGLRETFSLWMWSEMGHSRADELSNTGTELERTLTLKLCTLSGG